MESNLKKSGPALIKHKSRQQFPTKTLCTLGLLATLSQSN